MHVNGSITVTIYKLCLYQKSCQKSKVHRKPTACGVSATMCATSDSAFQTYLTPTPTCKHVRKFLLKKKIFSIKKFEHLFWASLPTVIALTEQPAEDGGGTIVK